MNALFSTICDQARNTEDLWLTSGVIAYSLPRLELSLVSATQLQHPRETIGWPKTSKSYD
jgi:hypothetical protein